MIWLAALLTRKAAPFAVAGLAALCVALFVSCGVLAISAANARAGLAKANARHAKALQTQAEDYAEQVRVAKEDFEGRVKDAQANADRLTKELNDARDHESRLAGDIRNGARIVRREICPTANVRSPQPAAAAGVDGQPAIDGASYIGRAVRAGAEADARLKACIAIAKRDRKP